MKNRINNILIGLLWLLAVALGATFWFNTKYGFNIFSLQHWQYLAYMQASGQPVQISFYISLLLIIVIAVFGLYQLLQPRTRRIILPVFDKAEKSNSKQSIIQPVPSVANPVIQQDKNETTETKKESLPKKNENINNNAVTRPPRLNIPTTVNKSAPIPLVPLASASTNKKFDPDQEYATIHDIFTSNGFVYKGSPRIKGMQTSVIAIGTNEVLWIGANGVSNSDMHRAVDTLQGIFTDTLEDIEINIKAFIVGTSDASSDDSIMQFANVDDLRAYINAHPNTPLSEDEIENFDAYSGYIGTVVDYIGKI